MRTPMSTQPGPATPALTTHFEPYVSVEKAAEYLDVAPKLSWRKHARARFRHTPGEMECARFGGSKSRS